MTIETVAHTNKLESRKGKNKSIKRRRRFYSFMMRDTNAIHKAHKEIISISIASWPAQLTIAPDFKLDDELRCLRSTFPKHSDEGRILIPPTESHDLKIELKTQARRWCFVVKHNVNAEPLGILPAGSTARAKKKHEWKKQIKRNQDGAIWSSEACRWIISFFLSVASIEHVKQLKASLIYSQVQFGGHFNSPNMCCAIMKQRNDHHSLVLHARWRRRSIDSKRENRSTRSGEKHKNRKSTM